MNDDQRYHQLSVKKIEKKYTRSKNISYSKRITFVPKKRKIKEIGAVKMDYLNERFGFQN